MSGKCWFKKIGLNSRLIHAYCQKHLGVSTRPRSKLEVTLCEAMSAAGHQRPVGIGNKKWVATNAHVIAGVARKHIADQAERALTFQASDNFLKTFEWRRARMLALKTHGARCQCCGATPAHGARMNVDHIKPRRLFPELALKQSNLQVLCEACNHGKGNWDQTDWRPGSGPKESAT